MNLPAKPLAITIAGCIIFSSTASSQRIAETAQPQATSAPLYSVSVLENIPNGTYTVAVAINNEGRVLGWAFDQAACNPLGCGAVWRGLKPTVLDTVPGALFTRPVAFNDNDEAVGLIYFNSTDSAVAKPFVGIHYPSQAVKWRGAAPTILESPSGVTTASATAINNAGEIVGSYGLSLPQAVVWHGTQPSNLPGGCSFAPLVNESGQLVCENTNGTEELIDGSTITILPTLNSGISAPAAINTAAQIVGLTYDEVDGNGIYVATYWYDGQVTALNSFNSAAFSGAYAINAHGNIVGFSTTTGGASHAVLWRSATSYPLDLNTVISLSQAAAITVTSAVGINDKCQIVANGIDSASGVARSYVLTPIGGAPCG